MLIRGQKVMLDADLAELFGVSTKVFNQAIRRNLDRFPVDFMFQLTENEQESLRSQFVTLKTGRGQHRKYLPYVFTEHGAIMAATILNSPKAVEMSVFIVRAFVQLREMLSTNKELAAKLLELERKVSDHDQAIAGLIEAINMKLAQRFIRPLARLRDNPEGWGEGNGHDEFHHQGRLAMPVRQLMMPAAGNSRPIGFTAHIEGDGK